MSLWYDENEIARSVFNKTRFLNDAIALWEVLNQTNCVWPGLAAPLDSVYRKVAPVFWLVRKRINLEDLRQMLRKLGVPVFTMNGKEYCIDLRAGDWIQIDSTEYTGKVASPGSILIYPGQALHSTIGTSARKAALPFDSMLERSLSDTPDAVIPVEVTEYLWEHEVQAAGPTKLRQTSFYNELLRREPSYAFIGGKRVIVGVALTTYGRRGMLFDPEYRLEDCQRFAVATG